jgi:hypothetical protein
MLYQLENLKVKQVEQLFDGPALVALYIASSDGSVDQNEVNRAIELVHIKTFSEYADLQDFYKQLEPDFTRRFNHIRSTLPMGRKERDLELIKRLTELNSVMAMLPYKFSLHYYKSLRNYAVHIANTSYGMGGFFDYTEEKRKLTHLDMLKEPTHITEKD